LHRKYQCTSVVCTTSEAKLHTDRHIANQLEGKLAVKQQRVGCQISTANPTMLVLLRSTGLTRLNLWTSWIRAHWYLKCTIWRHDVQYHNKT